MARGVRRETRWMATPSPMVSIAPTRVTTANAGRSAQNSALGVRSNPGQEARGTPTQEASSICCASYRPKGAATAQPTTIPITGDHSRQAAGARSMRTATVTIVATVAAGAAAGDVPSGTSFMVSNTSGITVAAISMITVPETTGVNIRRSNESRAASANWNSDDTTMRLALVDGPPSTRAATQTAMNAPEVPMISTCPAPTRPAWRIVVAPLTTRAAKTAHDM